MKYLSEYVQAGQTKAFDKAGAFFAFSNKQYDEKAVEGVKYVHMFGGLICPKENADDLLKGLDEVHKKGIEQDIKENGLSGIVRRELNNYEAYYTGDISDTVNALKGYPVTNEQVFAVFKNKNAIL